MGVVEIRLHLAGLVLCLVLVVLVSYGAAPYYAMLNPKTGIWGCIEQGQPPSRTVKSFEGLGAEALVVWDSWGVPHIYAESEKDVYFAFGYVQAADRLWQMDLTRRLAEGRLSEVVGEIAYDSDVFFRVVGLERAARETWEYVVDNDEELRAVLEAYSAGVNAYMCREELPVEFRLLGYRPEAWTPIDTLAIAKLIGWSLTGTFNDIVRAYMASKLGEETVNELFPLWEYELVTIVPQNYTKPAKQRIRSLPPVRDDVVGLLEWANEAREWMRVLGLGSLYASNNWVVDGALTETGKPLLCNDPHLDLITPPVWYEAHLVVRGRMNVRGVAFPGVPVIVIGRNDRIGWGLTNVGADVIDFYYYVWGGGGERYWYIDHWEDVEHVAEVIRVKVGKRIVERAVYVNFTRHGPIIERGGVKYAVRWTGHGVSLEARTFYELNKARNLEDFIHAMRSFSVPAQNTIYADVDGNIAYYPAAKYPIREGNVPGWLPFNGSAGEGEWVGFIPFEQIPHLINPPKHYIATANNRPVGPDYPYYLGSSDYFYPSYRERRIVEFIEEAVSSGRKLTVEDMMLLQGDVLSIPAREMTPLLLEAYSANPVGGEAVAEAVEALRGWDYRMEVDEVAPTIFWRWMEKLRKNTFLDEYLRAGLPEPPPKPGTELRAWGKLAPVYPDYSVLIYFAKTNYAKYFDDVSTPEVETRDEIMVKSLVEAVEELRSELGDDVSSWTWGRIHKRYFRHALGKVLPWLNYGEFPDGGDAYTVDVAAGYPSTHGPSWREILDFSGPEGALCVIPGGESGCPFSPHYGDQLPLWLGTQYKEMLLPEAPDAVENVERVLVLRPVGGG